MNWLMKEKVKKSVLEKINELHIENVEKLIWEVESQVYAMTHEPYFFPEEAMKRMQVCVEEYRETKEILNEYSNEFGGKKHE